MTENNKEEPLKPHSITDDREVIDMRNVSDPRVIQAVKEILSATWALEGAEFDHEVD